MHLDLAVLCFMTLSYRYKNTCLQGQGYKVIYCIIVYNGKKCYSKFDSSIPLSLPLSFPLSLLPLSSSLLSSTNCVPWNNSLQVYIKLPYSRFIDYFVLLFIYGFINVLFYINEISFTHLLMDIEFFPNTWLL